MSLRCFGKLSDRRLSDQTVSVAGLSKRLAEPEKIT